MKNSQRYTGTHLTSNKEPKKQQEIAYLIKQFMIQNSELGSIHYTHIQGKQTTHLDLRLWVVKN